MTDIRNFPVPAWVEPDQRTEFAVRLAALYHNKAGSLGELSLALNGCNSRSLLHMALKSSGGLNAKTCIRLEEVLGRENFPREFFRPDIFLPE